MLLICKQHDKMKFKNQYGPPFMYWAVEKRHKSCIII